MAEIMDERQVTIARPLQICVWLSRRFMCPCALVIQDAYWRGRASLSKLRTSGPRKTSPTRHQAILPFSTLSSKVNFPFRRRAGSAFVMRLSVSSPQDPSPRESSLTSYPCYFMLTPVSVVHIFSRH